MVQGETFFKLIKQILVILPKNFLLTFALRSFFITFYLFFSTFFNYLKARKPKIISAQYFGIIKILILTSVPFIYCPKGKFWNHNRKNKSDSLEYHSKFSNHRKIGNP